MYFCIVILCALHAYMACGAEDIDLRTDFPLPQALRLPVTPHGLPDWHIMVFVQGDSMALPNGEHVWLYDVGPHTLMLQSNLRHMELTYYVEQCLCWRVLMGERDSVFENGYGFEQFALKKMGKLFFTHKDGTAIPIGEKGILEQFKNSLHLERCVGGERAWTHLEQRMGGGYSLRLYPFVDKGEFDVEVDFSCGGEKVFNVHMSDIERICIPEIRQNLMLASVKSLWPHVGSEYSHYKLENMDFWLIRQEPNLNSYVLAVLKPYRMEANHQCHIVRLCRLEDVMICSIESGLYHESIVEMLPNSPLQCVKHMIGACEHSVQFCFGAGSLCMTLDSFERVRFTACGSAVNGVAWVLSNLRVFERDRADGEQERLAFNYLYVPVLRRSLPNSCPNACEFLFPNPSALFSSIKMFIALEGDEVLLSHQVLLHRYPSVRIPLIRIPLGSDREDKNFRLFPMEGKCVIGPIAVQVQCDSEEKSRCRYRFCVKRWGEYEYTGSILVAGNYLVPWVFWKNYRKKTCHCCIFYPTFLKPHNVFMDLIFTWKHLNFTWKGWVSHPIKILNILTERTCTSVYCLVRRVQEGQYEWVVQLRGECCAIPVHSSQRPTHVVVCWQEGAVEFGLFVGDFRADALQVAYRSRSDKSIDSFSVLFSWRGKLLRVFIPDKKMKPQFINVGGMSSLVC